MSKFKKGEEVKLTSRLRGFTEAQQLTDVKRVIYKEYTGGWGNNSYNIEVEFKDGTKLICNVNDHHIKTLYSPSEYIEKIMKGEKV